MKVFHKVKKTTNRVKMMSTELEKNISSNSSKKELITSIYKELKRLILS